MNSSSAAIGSGATRTPNTSNRILVVLSDEQRDEYKAEFDPLAVAGIELVYESSAEQALEDCMSGDLALVIVGMTMETMDGLEFVAQLMRQNPKFDRKIVVLPEKADPFPPMIQWYDSKSGRSTTEESDLAAVLALAHSFAPGPASVPSPASAKASGSHPTQQARVSGPSSGPSVAKAGSADLRRSPISSPASVERAPKPSAPVRSAPAAPVASLKKTSLGLGLPTTKEAPTQPAPPLPPMPAPRAHSPELVAFSNTVLAVSAVPPIPRLPAALAPTPADPPPAGAAAAAAGAPPQPFAAASPVAVAPPLAAASPAAVAPPLAAAPQTAQTSEALTAAAPQNALPFAAALPNAYPPAAASGVGADSGEHGSVVLDSAPRFGSAREGFGAALAQAKHSAARAATKWKALPRGTQAIIAAAALVLLSAGLILAFASRSSDASAEPARSVEREQPRTPTKPATGTIGKNESTVSNTPNPSRAAPALPAAPARGEPDLRELTTLPLAFERATEAYSVSDAGLLSRIVQALREALEKDAAARVEVGGHASQEGNARFNWEVAGRRAATVRDYLQQQGIAGDRIKLRSYGTVRPLNAGEREENRRVTIRLLP